jgi:hypothetical protein
MATEHSDPRLPARRRFLIAAAACGASAWIAPAWGTRMLQLAAAWDEAQGHRIGVLGLEGGTLAPRTSLDVPTRAHGLAIEPDGSVLAVARRPGDWMLRWQPGQRTATWVWAEPGRAFNGHVAASADRRRLFTSETALDSGAGLIGVRDARSLEKLAEWPTHGIDPHALLVDGNALIVANGGVPTRPETGRIKRDLQRMDSSLARINASDGALLGQWRLDDQRLSLRHLARNGALVGIALQAEHDEPATRASAPLLALFDGRQLVLAAPQHMPPLAGYGGDIAAYDKGFAVGAPRANRIARWHPDGGWQPPLELAEGCALASANGRVWAAGRGGAASFGANDEAGFTLPHALRIDNHWVALVN